jgi:hypothetical protein
MKIYIPEICLSNIDVSLIKPYIISSQNKYFLWCLDSLLEIKNNKIYELNILDKKCVYTKIFNLDIIIDESDIDNNTLIEDNITFQIPPNHIEEMKVITKYQLIPNSNVFLITEKNLNENNKEINDFYFYINTPITNDLSASSYINENFNLEKKIEENMHAFLTILKLCN